MSEMREVTVVTTATMRETWTYLVPADTDLSELDHADMNRLVGQGRARIVGCKDTVGDERGRTTELVAWASGN